MSGPTYIIARIHHFMRQANPEIEAYLQSIRDDGYKVLELAPDINGNVDFCVTFESDAEAVIFRLKHK
jgi:hypothetical protein